MHVNQIRSAKGAIHKSKRVGRGSGSGHGRTACRGNNGQGCRTGGTKPPGFEGGQMPLIRRIPKFGFHSMSAETFQVVNLYKLDPLTETEFGPEKFITLGLIADSDRPIKILGEGEIGRVITIRAHAFSQTAKEKILNAGGKIEFIKG